MIHGKILVVDDDAAIRTVVSEALKQAGHEVKAVPDLLSMRRLLAEGFGEVLVTDVVLPGKVRGRELAERITAIRPEVKVLFMSGYTENSIVHHGRLDDGVQLLGKPFKRGQLARKIAEVLGVTAGSDATAEGDNVVDLRARQRE